MDVAPESPSDLWLEQSNFLGDSLGSIAYGIFATVFFITFYYIIKKPVEGNKARKHRAINLTYIFVLFAVTTGIVAAEIRLNMLAFIDHRNYPGGPAAYSLLSGPELIVGHAVFVASNFLTDGLLLYRCLIIWQNNYFMVFPSLLFFASTAISIITVYEVSRLGSNLRSMLTVDFAVPYWSLSISLNVIVTLLISGRLFMMRKRMREVLGERHAMKYTSAIAMLVESAALSSGTGLIYLIVYARKSNVQNIVWPALNSVMPTAPLLILLRVASGTGFSRQTTYSLGEETKPLSFAPGPTMPTSQVAWVQISVDELAETSRHGSRHPKTGAF